MIRFLILCVIFFLLYLGFDFIKEFDVAVNIAVLDYQIITSSFVFLAIFLAIQLMLTIFFRIIFLIFKLPSIVRSNWRKRKSKRINADMLIIISELLMNNRKGALEITGKWMPYFNQNNKEVMNLVLAESANKFDIKIQKLRNLVDKKNYSLYSAKRLAQIFFDNKNYLESEEYASKAFNENSADPEIIIMLIRIYAKQELWKKMIFVISKLQRISLRLLEHHSKEISRYYYLAAKSFIAKDGDYEAINLLKSSLELNPTGLESLNLLVELHINNADAILPVLKSAFKDRPCFEIAVMYIKSSKRSASMIYDSLASLAKPLEYHGLFLAIAAYLGLYDKIADITEFEK